MSVTPVNWEATASINRKIKISNNKPVFFERRGIVNPLLLNFQAKSVVRQKIRTKKSVHSPTKLNGVKNIIKQTIRKINTAFFINSCLRFVQNLHVKKPKNGVNSNNMQCKSVISRCQRK